MKNRTYYKDETLTIFNGDAVAVLSGLQSESVQTVVTSPPYWGLRDYGVQGQIGLEETPAKFIENLVTVFREVWRVLKNDGTLWLNIGDSYAGYWGENYSHKPFGKDRTGDNSTPPNKISPDFKKCGFKPKDLIGIPWMLAFALRNDGWFLRSDIIWNKPCPMPESVSDRPTKSHEYIFLFSKSKKYFYDKNAIMEPVSEGTILRLSQDLEKQTGSIRANGGKKINGNMKAVGGMEKRNKRSVWNVSTVGYSEAHFATFPPKLIEPCILAGSRPGDAVLDPFFGSGTTGMVALNHGRKAIGIELSRDYCGLAFKRCRQGVLPIF